MADESIFTQDNPQEEIPQHQEVPTSIEDWVGDGKKYASVDEFVKAFSHAQNHIQNLEGQVQGLHEDLVKRQTAEELFENYVKPNQATQDTPPEESQGVEDPDDMSQPAQTISEEDLLAKVDERLEQRDQSRKATENEEKVSNVLRERYGDSAPRVLKERADELGKSVEDLQKIAQNDPNLFMALFPPQQRNPSHSPAMRGEMTPESQPRNRQPDHPTYSFYENMRKNDPARYWDPKTQAKIVREAERYGDAFYDS